MTKVKYFYSLEAFLVTATAMFLLGVAVLMATPAFGAGDDRQCSVTFTNVTAGTTATPTTGTCLWARGSTLLMQCDAAVFFSSTTTATATDFKVDFTVNPDPYIIYQLDSGGASGLLAKDVSILGVSASGTCKFAKTNRRKPL